MKKVTVLNTSTLTVYGKFEYKQITLDEAKELVKKGFKSAVGHQSTCDVLTKLLDVEVPMNRIQFKQSAEDLALVFKLKGRPEEGKILTAEEIELIGYEFGTIEMIS